MTPPADPARVAQYPTDSGRRTLRNVVPWWVVAVVMAAFVIVPAIRCVLVRGDLTSLVHFGRDFEPTRVTVIRDLPHHVFDGPGFDGQFYVQLATDPLLLRPETAVAMDNVTVRARRVLLPATAWLVSGGGAARAVLWIYPLLNFVAWIALGVVAWRALPRDGLAGPAAFLAIVAGPGAVESVSRGLPDLPAFVLAFVSLGIPSLGGAVLLALAGLGRETTLLAWPAKLADPGSWRSDWRRRVVEGAVVIAPLAVWMISLQLRFGNSGGRVDGGNLALPLSGVIMRMQEIAAQFAARPLAGAVDLVLHPAMQSAVLLVSLAVQLAFLVANPERSRVLWRWGLLTGLLALCLGWATWEAFYTITRHLLPLHMAFNLLLACSRKPGRWAWFLLGNLYVLPRALYWLGYP